MATAPAATRRPPSRGPAAGRSPRRTRRRQSRKRRICKRGSQRLEIELHDYGAASSLFLSLEPVAALTRLPDRLLRGRRAADDRPAATVGSRVRGSRRNYPFGPASPLRPSPSVGSRGAFRELVRSEEHTSELQ